MLLALPYSPLWADCFKVYFFLYVTLCLLLYMSVVLSPEVFLVGGILTKLCLYILYAHSFLSEKFPLKLWVKFQGLFGSFFLIGIRRNSSKGEGHFVGVLKRCCVFPPAFGCGVHLKDNKNNFWAVLRLDSAFHLLFIFYHLKRRTNVFLLIAWCWSTPIR